MISGAYSTLLLGVLDDARNEKRILAFISSWTKAETAGRFIKMQ